MDQAESQTSIWLADFGDFSLTGGSVGETHRERYDDQPDARD